MQARFPAYLHERYRFEAWRDRNRLSENLFVWQSFLPEALLPGWQLHRSQVLEAASPPPAVAGPRGPAPATPRYIQSTWLSFDDPREGIVNVDIYECTSRSAAHQYLLGLLGEYQSAQLTEQEQAGAGDVVFAAPNGLVILAARANLVYSAHNAGRRPEPVTEAIQRLDREVCERPQATSAEGAPPRIERFQAAAGASMRAARVPLDVAAEAASEPVMYKFFSGSGEVMVDGGRLMYRPAATGPQEVTVYAVGARTGASSRELRMTLEGRRRS